MTVAAVIVAGGSGLRAGGETPKQYQTIGGRPVLWWTLKAFAEHPGIARVQTVIGEGHEAMFAAATEGLTVEPAVTGGATRQDSCRAGLEAVARHQPEKVLIHDAARPFASRDLISHVIAWLDRHRAVVPGLPVAETLKLAPGGIVTATVDRSGLWTAQTPQGFGFEAILTAHRAAHAAGVTNLTDDAAVAERLGIEIAMIPGRVENRKLTTAEDIETADRAMMAARLDHLPDIRVGQGIDVHPFAEGNGVTLCGVSIPHDRSLAGHSDADVAMHALTDAIFGAIGDGDIGVHFPPTDRRWKGAASAIFLAKAVELVHRRSGLIANADLTILAEAPRIAPHIAAMKAVLAPLLGIAAERIAIKATTAEKLGAIGRGEGIVAFATAMVRLP
ncbi:MAG: bifunctional 2-C-methyl-D-erythritol 4-phosphate cytidylyltransferase/2-C-methyl-D-erythritol 2,4-cyclodiphosphate synthase [Rhizobiales bacterium]|nr:bifunctional 2-C-methyl-D-erythritol 4-phosphate cytidylyltransferase/2-C-methyl-D-erythritol 2,4-cyclodiphosphate synthase [Hyphomicrobiales bacterium]MBI3673547.1 bifunctional 2-C-methyl-D-erythritol 4-phosphate cytidylyltransferase/2-C-methyl-D-erythritol 2,4-cyclodiphosphate synthase [Hyphomicrobiales bacterium]